MRSIRSQESWSSSTTSVRMSTAWSPNRPGSSNFTGREANTSTVNTVCLRPTSAPTGLVIVQNLLELRLLGRVGAEREIELVVVRALFDVALAGKGDAHAPV